MTYSKPYLVKMIEDGELRPYTISMKGWRQFGFKFLFLHLWYMNRIRIFISVWYETRRLRKLGSDISSYDFILDK